MIGWSAIVAGVTAAVVAQQAPQVLVVEVGQTVEIEVGWATGHACDDLAVVAAELHAGSRATNVFAVTGRAEGVTACRVGTALGRPSFLFQVEVVPASNNASRDVSRSGPGSARPAPAARA